MKVTATRRNQLKVGLISGLLVLSGILYLILPIAALNWSTTPFPGFMVDPNLVVNSAAEPNWPALQVEPPVTYPQRVTAVAGQPVTTLTQYQDALAAFDEGDEVEFTFAYPQNSRLTLEIGDQIERTVTLPLIRIDAAGIWNRFWLFYLTGLLMLIIGGWTFRARPELESSQVFAAFAAVGAIAIGGIFDLTSTQYLARFWTAAISMSSGLVLLLALIFPHETRFLRNYPFLKWLVLIPGLIITVWGQFWLYLPGDPWAYAIPWQVAYFTNGICLLLAMLVMAYRSFSSHSPLVRQQGTLILSGAFFAFAPVTFFFITAPLSINFPWLTTNLYIPPIIIFPLVIGYSIIRYRLLDTDFSLRRGVVYTLLFALLVSAFTLLVTGVSNALGLAPVVENPLLLALFVVIVSALFNPLRTLLQQALDQYFFRQPAGFDTLLQAYNRELTQAIEVNQIADVLLTYAQMGVPATRAHLYLQDDKLNGYSSITNHNSTVIPTNSVLVEYMQLEKRALDLAEERTWPESIQEEAAVVRALEAAVLIPIQNGKQLLGWLAVSDKSNGERVTQAEMAYLNGLANQSLIGLERANVIRRLETRVAELDMLSQFSQALNFTIDLELLLELAFTNFEHLLNIDAFYIALRDRATGRFYTAFYLEDGERLEQFEGKPLTNAHVIEVIELGQKKRLVQEDGRFWMYAPLNAGAETLGVVYTCHPQPGLEFPRRQQQLFQVFSDQLATSLDRLDTRQQIERRAGQLRSINQITSSLSSTLEVEPLLNLILDSAIELLDTEAGTFMMTIEDTGELEFKVVRGPASLLGTRLPIGAGLAGTAAQEGRPLIVNSVQEDKRWFDQVDAETDFESQSILTAPLIRNTAVLGVIQVINKRNRAPFDSEDQNLLMTFAGQAVVALENARLLAQTDQMLEARVQELQALQELDRDLNTTLDLTRVLDLTLAKILRICNCDRGSIILKDMDEQPTVQAMYGYEIDFSAEEIERSIVNGGTLINEVLTSEQTQVGTIEADSLTTNAQMAIPIIHKQELIGVIAMESGRTSTFDHTTIAAGERATNHAAIAIANALLYEQVQAANQAKSEFVSMVSHELKTPMTSMRGYIDLLLSGMTGELNEQQRGFLETAAANVRRMGQQISDLTDISRIETGRLHVKLKETSFSTVLSETLEIVQGPCDEKGINLHLDLPADLPTVNGDKDRLVQVLTNLISNACKYSPANTAVYVTFKAELSDCNRERTMQPMIICTVKDEGYGISTEDQERLFTKFFRADDPNIRQASGTGLGLSITRGIIELHGGLIWVESQLNQGTAFTFSIPQLH